VFELIRTLRIDGDRADGTAEIPAEHPMLADHFPGRPLLPGTWAVELGAQIAGPLAETCEENRWAVLAMIQDMKLLAPVDLPALLNIEATIVRRAREIITTRVTVWLDDVTVLRGELVFALVEPRQGTESAVRERNERLWRWSKP
jgi:3-hydroxymyristoyl/3-hydroxydecanoyl-(acyl carrier protein) dehydratase